MHLFQKHRYQAIKGYLLSIGTTQVEQRHDTVTKQVHKNKKTPLHVQDGTGTAGAAGAGRRTAHVIALAIVDVHVMAHATQEQHAVVPTVAVGVEKVEAEIGRVTVARRGI
jgi:hypothetical protein